MPEITVLSQETINQIAAGEVIDRPSSVVKELLENAIDAGATAVTIEIKDGGISLVRITDNGCGIEREQIPTAFLRHSTSKIRSAADLLTVSSLGFRGEALSSIAAVSQVELITKTAGELTGSRYQIHGGKEISLEEVGAPEGTTFLVRNLFYNTPARKKFLKAPQTEGSYISSLVERIALSRPDVSLRFIQNGQNRLHTSGNHNLKDLIYMIFGREIAGNLLPIEAEGDHMRITGFLGKPVISRGNRTYENYFINGRYIKSNLINKAIEDGYHSYLMQHKYPFVALHLTIEPEFLDVNVHPSKMELRFRDQEEVYQALYHAVHDTLAGKEHIRNVSLGEEEGRRKEGFATEKKETTGSGKRVPERGPEPFELQRSRRETGTPGLSAAIPPVEMPEFLKESSRYQVRAGKPQAERNEKPNTVQVPAGPVKEPEQETGPAPKAARAAKENNGRPEEAGAAGKAKAPEQLELFEEKLLTKEARAEYRFIGQLFDTYWLIQYRDEFLIIDQHAAHEKVLYERLLRELSEKKVYGQQIDPPILLTLNLREEEVLSAHRDRFRALGFEIEPFGGKEYAVYSVPANLYGIAEQDILMELIDSLSDELSHGSEELIMEKLASMSCKAAVKGGDRLSVREAEALIDELLALENPYACPHGRPTVISMSRRELEKKFKRIV